MTLPRTIPELLDHARGQSNTYLSEVTLLAAAFYEKKADLRFDGAIQKLKRSGAGIAQLPELEASARWKAMRNSTSPLRRLWIPREPKREFLDQFKEQERERAVKDFAQVVKNVYPH